MMEKNARVISRIDFLIVFLTLFRYNNFLANVEKEMKLKRVGEKLHCATQTRIYTCTENVGCLPLLHIVGIGSNVHTQSQTHTHALKTLGRA